MDAVENRRAHEFPALADTVNKRKRVAVLKHRAKRKKLKARERASR